MPDSKLESQEDHPLSESPPTIYPPVPGGQSTSSFVFNLPRFIPLLAERIHAIAPATRLFLVQWIYILNSVPDLDLISYLPEFMDGLFRFLSDSNSDVKTATLNVLGEFMKEIQEICESRKEAHVSQEDNTITTRFTSIVLDFARMTDILAPYLSSKG